MPFFVLAVSGCGLLWLSSTARLLAQDALPVFRAHTDLVRLDVSITGQDGRPVDDVRADEIEISENGRPRPVVLFRHLSQRSGGDPDSSSALFNEVSRNSENSPGHLYVLVFDQAHMTIGGEQRVREAALRLLTRTVKSGDAVAIYALPGPGPMLDFTTDLARVRGRLAEMHAKTASRVGGPRGLGDESPVPADPRQSRATIDPMAASQVTHAVVSPAASREDAETHVFLSGLAQVMTRLRCLEGRKSVVLFSDGFGADNLGSEIERVASAAAQSESVIQAVDTSAASRGAAGGSGDGLARLAGETDGRVLTDLATFDQVIANVADGMNDYYLLGFEPGESETAFAYHPVKVRVLRRGLVAHARTGYSSAPAATPASDRQAIDVALSVPRTSSALPIEYTTYERVGPSPDKPRIIASVRAYVPRTACDHPADVVFVVRDVTTGQAVASGTDQVRLQGAANDVPGALEPIPYSVQFDVPPGEYWMRVLVREPGGVIGTADRRLHVWPLSGEPLATSDLIIAPLHGARFDAPTQAEVHREDDVLAYAEVYGNSETLQAANAKVEIGRADSGEIVATVDPLVKSGTVGERVLRALLPVASLGEGRYFARVRIAAPNQAGKTVMRYFRIVAPERAKPHTH